MLVVRGFEGVLVAWRARTALGRLLRLGHRIVPGLVRGSEFSGLAPPVEHPVRQPVTGRPRRSPAQLPLDVGADVDADQRGGLGLGQSCLLPPGPDLTGGVEPFGEFRSPGWCECHATTLRHQTPRKPYRTSY